MAQAVSFESLEARLRDEACGVQADSRKITKGDIFVAVPGESEDGAVYIEAAVKAGAAYVVLNNEAYLQYADKLPDTVSFCVRDDIRASLSRLAGIRFHTAQHTLKILGITGTNGKTTATYLLEALLTSLGAKVGVLGTVSYRWPGFCEAAPLTTPDPLRIHSLLHDMEKAGCSWAVMEVSSHSIEQKRVADVPFSGVAFTNLTQDHLDFHTSMERYFAVKARLFTELPLAEKRMAINCDDQYGKRLLAMCPDALAYGFSEYEAGRRLTARILRQDTQGLRLAMRYGNSTWELASPLVGAFNAANLLTVQALALEMGIGISDLAALEHFPGVKGRLERIDGGGKHIFVDYAHTPDALVNVLSALRKAGFQKIITVFGCGGNRDRGKRPLMGEAVAKYSDWAVLTSDNPRNEDPMAIIEDVKPGLVNAANLHVEPDRKEATRFALDLATGPHDCVLIAGKGHEDYQIIQGVRHHYSDQEVVRELLGCA
ncbi:MAG: UDP-N-acetylmuramoyl-L-alanyl-D-glutamate--2,6-diaminopimelate ligase [Desulfovibrio sp.]|nr:UDP-N-acetylmuramoyl-L-alanyl-D-glutamate--2,6-diaminopimelate ligase [Desulfovibrio sp.]